MTQFDGGGVGRFGQTDQRTGDQTHQPRESEWVIIATGCVFMSHQVYESEEIRSVLISGDREAIEKLHTNMRRLKQNFDRGLLV